ncbi:hypothetical protein F3Y22_tig00110057pilonHSYRG00290 [Hibiscus syriacus]|uniref:Transmembrane protein n=1 Tax=Hibiscus syriacus TaxID=106335 RepID=A0A6A3BQS4_HIBSY|nr:hypothetical protein F3Y22_tig00110057pilonHSYRG00290 [Hibiscus syriacus]
MDSGVVPKMVQCLRGGGLLEALCQRCSPSTVFVGGFGTFGGFSLEHLVDVTEIFNLLHEEKQQRIFKLAYVAVLIFFALFWIICTALEDVDD